MKKIWSWIRFVVALWAGKFFLFLYRHTGRERNDMPGVIAVHLCPDFLKYIKKPKLTVAVTGTNGKTTISCVTASTLRAQGKRVSYNEWGANFSAGQARCLLDTVNIFNRSRKDAAIIEMDEVSSPKSMPLIDPDYVIVNNLGRDSMLRNAHPEYIYDRLNAAIEASPKATLILNADDPVSSSLGSGHRRIFFGVADQHVEARPALVDDFGACPVCGAKPRYNYRNYRHIGDFYCPNCGLKSKDRDYFATEIDYGHRKMTVREPDNTAYQYPLISDSLHNAYNLVAVVTILRDLKISPEEIASGLGQAKIPSSRESRERVGNIELITHIVKGQNATAASTVFEYIAKDPAPKEIIMVLDEIFDDPLKTETIAWIYDSDYEYLNVDNIQKIILGGARYLDHRLRMLLAGIPEEKIQCIRDELDTANYVDTQGIEKIYVLHDVNAVAMGRKIRDAVRQRLLAEGGGNIEN